MQKFEIKKRWNGSVIFSAETESFKLAVKLAIKQHIDLRGSDLRGIDLSGIDLRGIDLRGSDLSDSNLSGSDLSGSDLSGSNLSFSKTDKRYIQVGCIGSRKGMTTYCFEDDKIWCGCFSGTLEEFEKKVKETHKDNKQYLDEYLGFISYIKSLNGKS